MQVIGLIGYVDKYDFAINLAKAINVMNKSVLVVDATNDKKLQAIIPSLDNIGDAYITQYNNIDFALGFKSLHDIENYTAEQGINLSLYDYILIDIDTTATYELFRSRNFDRTYFFIDTSVLSVSKNKELVKSMRVYNKEEALKITKVLYRAYMSRAAEEYFENQIESYNVEWQEPEYEIPIDEIDKITDIDSQFSGIIEIRKHSKMFINTIADLTSEILDEVTAKEVIREIKRRKD
ncbi:MAG: hypothetical protein RSB67_03935 [Clostridia bacterium]